MWCCSDCLSERPLKSEGRKDMERIEALEFALLIYFISQLIISILWLYFQVLRKDKKGGKEE